MKRFINIATAAALTTSMICVPTAIVVSAAETASFEACMPDQVIKSGERTVTIPVSFDEDITFSSLDMEFISSFTAPSNCTASIKSVESALSGTTGVTVALDKNSVVKVSSSKDYTLKKGTVLFNITAEIGNLQTPDGTEKWPIGASFRVSVNDFTMISSGNKETKMSSEALIKSNSVIQVIPQTKTEGMSVKLSSVSATSNIVKVPVIVTGGMMAFISEFKVDNRAKITNITSSAQTNLTIEYKKGNYSRALWTSMKDENTLFDNSEVLVLTVELPADAKESDKFTVSVSSFDPASANTDETIYPSTITSGVITYTPSAATGSVLSDVKLSSPYIVSKSKALNLNDLKLTATITNKDGVKETIQITNPAADFEIVGEETGSIDRSLTLKYVGQIYTCPDSITLSYLRGFLGDINLDGKVDTRDELITINEYTEHSFGGDYVSGVLQKSESLKSVIEKYSMETVRAFAVAVGDVDSNGKNDTRDALLQIKYYGENAFSEGPSDEVSWDTILGK